jgi:hypothetical protein
LPEVRGKKRVQIARFLYAVFMPRELPQLNTFPHSHGIFFPTKRERGQEIKRESYIHIPMEIFLFYQMRKNPGNKKRVVCIRGGWLVPNAPTFS